MGLAMDSGTAVREVRRSLETSEQRLREAALLRASVTADRDELRRGIVQERAALHAMERRLLELEAGCGVKAEEPEPVHPDRAKHDSIWRSHWILGRSLRLPAKHELASGHPLPSPADDPALTGLPNPDLLHAARCLLERDFAVLDDFWPAADCRRIRAELHRDWRSGHLSPGVIGTGAACDSAAATTMRSDLIRWHEGGDPGTEAATEFLEERADIFIQKLGVLLQSIGAEDWQPKSRSKMMFAVYPGDGTHYVKHYDNPNRNGRKVTLLLYLNEDWQPSHGGHLRIGRDAIECSERPYADVAPISGRAVLFWSDRRCPHEVAPCHVPRYTLTTWYLDADEREGALRRGKGGKSDSKPTAPTHSEADGAEWL
eukprot:TRINITY_DN32686_c0_g1_i1.p1 TRINITY_DN32686_c0_g1~~TRINITY_DN32686_c0_g1_i1.p1  ORF type:complete len:387 (+),score=129.32 TRINITY_DN32686_c0_g1_i1:44-1162(+)